jgi:PTH2 family peptidyl-tRNA hydrolase
LPAIMAEVLAAPAVTDENSVVGAPDLPQPVDDAVASATGDAEEDTKQEACDGEEALSSVYVLALVVRSDLGMGRSKIATQCGIATLAAVWRSFHQPAGSDVPDWRASGEEKVVLSCDGDVAFSKLCARAAVCGIETLAVLEHGERTVLAVGPAPAADLQLVTGELAPLDLTKVVVEVEAEAGAGASAVDATAEKEAEEKELAAKREAASALLPRVAAAAAAANDDAGEDLAARTKFKPNAKCHCGSGNKYKKCCAAMDLALKQAQDELTEAVVAVLGKANADAAADTGGGKRAGGAVPTAKNKPVDRGVKVMAFRKQGEYGPKKFIKP